MVGQSGRPFALLGRLGLVEGGGVGRADVVLRRELHQVAFHGVRVLAVGVVLGLDLRNAASRSTTTTTTKKKRVEKKANLDQSRHYSSIDIHDIWF